MGGSNGMIEPGNVSVSAPYWISAHTGTLTGLAAGQAVATLVNFGRTPELQNPSQALINVPINISQIRLKYLALTAGQVAMEIHKGTSTAQRTVIGSSGTGSALYGAHRRKTSGYRPIPTTEVSLFMAGDSVIGGGNFTSVNDAQPFDMMTLSSGTALAGSESIWTPSDLCPLMLEQNEACEVRATNFGAGTGILFVAFDFLRQ